MSKFFRSAGLAALAVAASLMGVSAQADTMLSTGQQIIVTTPDQYGTSIAQGAISAAPTITTAFNTSSGGTGTLTEQVFRETGGTYDFLYQVSNTGASILKSLDVTSFFGYNTSVGYSSTSPAGFAAGTVPTPNIARGFSGADVLFTFDSTGLSNGQTTNVFFVRTNATSFNALGGGIITGTNSGTNGTSVFTNLYQPFGATASVPEPGSVALLGCFAAVAGVGAWRRHRSTKASA